MLITLSVHFLKKQSILIKISHNTCVQLANFSTTHAKSNQKHQACVMKLNIHNCSDDKKYSQMQTRKPSFFLLLPDTHTHMHTPYTHTHHIHTSHTHIHTHAHTIHTHTPHTHITHTHAHTIHTHTTYTHHSHTHTHRVLKRCYLQVQIIISSY